MHISDRKIEEGNEEETSSRCETGRRNIAQSIIYNLYDVPVFQQCCVTLCKFEAKLLSTETSNHLAVHLNLPVRLALSLGH